VNAHDPGPVRQADVESTTHTSSVHKVVPQVNAGMTDPPELGDEAGQGLHHRQGDQFRIAELWLDSRLRPPGRQLRRRLQRVADLHVQCGGEGIQIWRHIRTSGSLVSCHA
jgi:hypothetical protein